jgi:hypothetical protein
MIQPRRTTTKERPADDVVSFTPRILVQLQFAVDAS